jgi:hypothetical protein
MKYSFRMKIFSGFICASFFYLSAGAQDLNLVGLTLLRTVATNVDGTGIRVAQPEGGYIEATNWQVNPGTILLPTNRFTYFSASGSSTNFPNGVGGESGHAHDVAANFYGQSYNPELSGIATNVAHVDNYDANYFIQESVSGIPFVYTNYTVTLPSTNINDPVVNQSFVIGTAPTDEQQAFDLAYDNYAAQYKTLFVSSVGNGLAESGNGGYSCAPGTCYNGIGVGAYRSSPTYPVNPGSSIGPTIDNGRCKPDITAPAAGTSFSSPQVAGAAAVLMQTGLRGDGGSDTNSAADIRTVKALLLNGAVKPLGWTNSNSSPLDARYGAGMLNIFNSYKQLTGGKQSYIVSTTVSPIGGVHPPNGATGTIGTLNGWDYNTNTSGKTPSQFDAVNHYYFNVTNNLLGTKFVATATLVWNKQYNKTAINNLGLFLYNCANSNLVACSTSLVDNVEHIYKTNLTQGRYDLQVWKAGGSGIVSALEPYALAFEFFSESLSISKSGTNVALTWPLYPAGFVADSATNLISPVWTNNLPSPIVTNGSNYILLNTTNATQFFHLRRPNF